MSRREDILRFVQLVHKHTPKDAWIAASAGTPPASEKHSWRTIFRQARDLNTLVDDIEKAEDKYQLYLRITPVGHRPTEGRGLEHDAIGSSVLWVDVDAYGRVEKAIEVLRSFAKPPTMILSTGGGVAAYWSLNEMVTDRNAVKARNKALKKELKEYNGDSCFDLARVMRIPGTWNLKLEEPRLATIIDYYPERVYSLADFPEAVLDDDDTLQLDSSPEPIPLGFEETVRKAKPRLWSRIYSAEGAPVAGSGNVDYSRNDWYIACALVSLGYSSGVVVSVLMHPHWASGEKYRRTRNALYVLKTASTAVRHVKGEAVPEGDGQRPAIYVPPGSYDVEDIVSKAFQLLTQVTDETNSPVLYINAVGELCELRNDPLTQTATIRYLDRHSLRRVVQQKLQWYTTTGKQERRPTTVPDKVLDTMLARPDDNVPLLYRVVTVPTFVRDEQGQPFLLSAPGYHAPSRIYYDPSVTCDPVPSQPSDAQLAEAKRWLLDELMHDFPFADNASRAHALGLLLLPFVRELIDGPTPFHLVDAPIQGSGKGLCVQAAMSVYFGSQLNHTSEASNDDEWRKRLLALARSGAQYLWIDNITKGMDWASIAAALTSGSVTERLLGQSQVVTAPIKFVWTGTANNAVMNDDLLRRIAYIRLNWTSKAIDEPKDLQPTTFKHFPLLEWSLSNRSKLVWAALVCCLGGMQRGKSGANKNSFEHWSKLMSGILDGLGVAGFLENDHDLREMTQDQSTDRTLDIMEAAVAMFGWGKEFTAKELTDKLTSEEGVLYMPDGIKNPSRFFGIMLSQFRDRVVASKYVIKRAGSKRDGYKWAVCQYHPEGSAA